jgi:tRNA 5-methylaminomethyl-2-thiouridine biosynthesis bifunctional protein
MVVGAGIAGCSIAGELVRAGIAVGLVDQHQGPALETSGHLTALAHPQVGKKITKLQRFTQLANQIANRQWQDSQIIQSAFEPRRDLNQEQLRDLAELCSEMGYDHETIQLIFNEEAKAKTNIDANGIWYKTAAVYNLPKICHQEIKGLLPEHLHWGKTIQKIQYHQNEWQVFSQDGELIGLTKALILANGMGAQELLKTIEINLPLRPVRGQLSTFYIQAESQLVPFLPKAVLRGDGYCLPAKKLKDGSWTWEVGSSYDEDHVEKNIWQQSDHDNAIKGLTLIGCEQSLIDELVPHCAYVGVRSASKDRLPLIGPVPQHPGLYLACAYGSRGVLWSALAAPLIRAYVEAFFAGADRLRAGFLGGASAALSAEVAASVNPARFLAGALGARTSNSKPIFPVS